jgi:hypothetical protein
MEVEQPESQLVLQSQDGGLVLQSQDAEMWWSLLPVIEIAYTNGMWWPLPPIESQLLYDKYVADETGIGYTWDWGNSRFGSWVRDGVKTSISRYSLDFTCMEQTNIDNKRKRSFRIAWVLPDQIEARWTGEFDMMSDSMILRDFPKP